MSTNCFIFVASANESATSTVGQMVYQALRPWSLQDLANDVDSAPGPIELGQAILRLGIAAPYAFDLGVFERIRLGLTHADERVRDMSLWATTYSPWPQYRGALAEIATHDVAVRLRERAQMTLDAFDAGGVEAP